MKLYKSGEVFEEGRQRSFSDVGVTKELKNHNREQYSPVRGGKFKRLSDTQLKKKSNITSPAIRESIVSSLIDSSEREDENLLQGGYASQKLQETSWKSNVILLRKLLKQHKKEKRILVTELEHEIIHLNKDASNALKFYEKEFEAKLEQEQKKFISESNKLEQELNRMIDELEKTYKESLEQYEEEEHEKLHFRYYSQQRELRNTYQEKKKKKGTYF